MTSDIATQIAALEAQENHLQFSRFSHDDAWEIGEALVNIGRERALSIAVDVSKGDQVVFHAALPGTTADNDDWIARKIRTVRRFGSSSLLVGRRHAAAATDFHTATGLPISLFTAFGGGFPVFIRNVGLVGTVTVSGLPDEDDHALAVEVLTRFRDQLTAAG